jgi:hypothetical protein
MLIFYCEGLLAPFPIPKLEDHLFSAVLTCLQLPSTADGRLLYQHLEDVPCRGNKGLLNVESQYAVC